MTPFVARYFSPCQQNSGGGLFGEADGVLVKEVEGVLVWEAKIILVGEAEGVLVREAEGVLVGEAEGVLVKEEDGEGFSSLIIIGLGGGESSTTLGTSWVVLLVFKILN